MTKSIGLFFGSFNPVHIGHMIIADYLAEHTALDEVWLVVSPHSPFKEKRTLARDHDRLHLVHLAIGNNHRLRACDIEFSLPKPSYSIDTLAYLKEKYPDYEFALIMGSDNLPTVPKWKNGHLLLENHHIYVYNRPGYPAGPLIENKKVHFVKAPLLDISSTYIRQLLADNKSVRYLLTDEVREYIESSGMYRKVK